MKLQIQQILKKEDLDLIYYKHNNNYLLDYYLMNMEKQFYFCPIQYESMDFNWANKQYCDYLFYFKLENGSLSHDINNK